jgi:hypothetical protein
MAITDKLVKEASALGTLQKASVAFPPTKEYNTLALGDLEFTWTTKLAEEAFSNGTEKEFHDRRSELTEEHVKKLESELRGALGNTIALLREESRRHGPITEDHDDYLHWSRLILVIADNHPWMLPLLKQLCPWFTTTPVFVHGFRQVYTWYRAMRQLSAHDMPIFIDSMSGHEHIPLLGIFAVFFSLKYASLQIRVPQPPAPTEESEICRISNHDYLFPPMASSTAMAVKKFEEPVASYEADSMRSNTRSALWPLESALGFYLQGARKQQVCEMVFDHHHADWNVFYAQVEKLYGKIADLSAGNFTVNELSREGVDMDEVKKLGGQQKWSPGPETLFGLVGNMPRHSTGLVFDFHGGYLYHSNRGHENIVPGIVRHKLKRVPSRHQWRLLQQGWDDQDTQAVANSELTDNQLFQLLGELADMTPGSWDVVRFLSGQFSGSCHLRAFMEMLRVVLTLTMTHQERAVYGTAKALFRKIVLKSYELAWDQVEADFANVPDDFNGLMHRSMIRAQVGAVITGDAEMFAFLKGTAGKSSLERALDLLKQQDPKLLLEERKNFFTKYGRLRNASLFHTIEDSNHEHANLPVKSIDDGPNASSVTLHERSRRKLRNWKSYETIGDVYLQRAAACKSPIGCAFPPFMVLLGQLFFMKYDGLMFFASKLSEAQRKAISQMALEWQGYTLMDALIYGQLCRSPSQEDYPQVYVPAAVFDCVYELQYGTDLNTWAKYAGVSMLAHSHHSYIFLDGPPSSIANWTPRRMLYVLSVLNQTLYVRFKGGKDAFFSNIRDNLAIVFSKYLTMPAQDLTNTEDRLIEELVTAHVMPVFQIHDYYSQWPHLFDIV